jgi:hypothetical protein
MMVLRFRGTIQITGLNPYLHVNAARARTLRPGWRRAMPVLIRINGAPRSQPWRTNMMPVGDGAFLLYLQSTVRQASGTKVGDMVRAEVRFDTAYRNGPQHPMPAWFRRPLRENRKAWATWQALIPSRKKEILRSLMGQSVRYMARSWGNPSHGRRPNKTPQPASRASKLRAGGRERSLGRRGQGRG